MIVVSAEEMRRLDELTIARGTPGYVLMERAGEGATAALLRQFPDLHGRRVVVVAGKGNNGGDGFVIARLLAGKGVNAEVLLLGRADEVRGDARRALQGLKGTAVQLREIFVQEAAHLLSAAFAGASLLVDAVFGTGLNAEVTGLHADALRRMNDAGIPIFAVDIPSGLDADRGRPLGIAIVAKATATFGFAKIGQVIQPGLQHVGAVSVIDIGIASEAVREVRPCVELLERHEVAALVPRRQPEAHKGTSGHLLIIAGSRGHTGAARLAAHAACRSGAGLTTLAGPASLNAIFALGIPEAMTATLPDVDGRISFEPDGLTHLIAGKQAIVIGPGLGTHEDAGRLLEHVLAIATVPVVVDADGLTCLARSFPVLEKSRCQVVMTPHPGEMARLLGRGTAAVQADRVGVARELASKHRCVVVLKGASSVVAAADGRAWINPTGNPGMASGGMGDVLAGLLGGLLAQGIAPPAAACLGTYLHGAVADVIANERGQIGMLASDVADGLPAGLKRLMLTQAEPRGISTFRYGD
jgi:NAD(P)H-hydrate epimerase